MAEISINVRDTDAERLEEMEDAGFLDEDMLAIEAIQTIREAWDSYQRQLEQQRQQQAMMQPPETDPEPEEGD